MKLIYGNRIADQIMYATELKEMQADLNLQVHHVLSEPPAGWTGAIGVIDEGLLGEVLDSTDRGTWLNVVCGPAPMIDSVETSLNRLGVPRHLVLAEKFSYD